MQPLLHTKNSNSSKSSSGNSCSSSCNDTLVTAHHQQCLLTVHASWSPPEQVNEQGTPSQPMTYFFHRAAAAIILAGQCQGQTLADKRNTFDAPPSDVFTVSAAIKQQSKHNSTSGATAAGRLLFPEKNKKKPMSSPNQTFQTGEATGAVEGHHNQLSVGHSQLPWPLPCVSPLERR